MNNKIRFAERLSKIIFLEINSTNINKLFNVQCSENIYFPLKGEDIVSSINKGENLDKIPIGFFIEGIIYVLGIDRNFKYGSIYKFVISKMSQAISFIKGRVYKKIKDDNLEEAFILLNGLLEIEKNRDIYDKLIMLTESLRTKDSSYIEEELEILKDAEKIEGYARPFLYEAILKKDKEEYERSLFCIEEYFSRDGEKTAEIIDMKKSVEDTLNYQRGINILYEKPSKALELLIPLMNTTENGTPLYYYIAVAYRLLENYEKAIYYLNEAMAMDNNFIEVANELGINYASLGNYKYAIAYFRKAFEATKSIEICTNLVMCYINSGDLVQAKNHLEIAKKLGANDDIVKQLDKIIIQ